MTAGDGDAFWADGTNADKLDEGGFQPLVSMEEIGIYTDEFFISSDVYVSEHQEDLVNFLKASKEIEDWVIANKEEAAQIAASEIGMTEEQFLSDLEAKNYGIVMPQEAYDHLTEIKDWAVNNGKFADYQIENFVDTTALDQAIQQ